jgi:hypothetical protein
VNLNREMRDIGSWRRKREFPSLLWNAALLVELSAISNGAPWGFK